MPLHDLIDNIALIAHPQPREGEVAPAEFYADAATEAQQQREDYAENLRGVQEATDEDPLLLALNMAAQQRKDAERLTRGLLAFGRNFTGGTRPGYSWQTLADAAHLPYATARRQIRDNDIAAVRGALGASPVAAQKADQ